MTKEEYIETIYILEKEGGKAQTGQIADQMNVKPPSVTEMLGKLREEGLVDYEPYLGATLTPSGMRMAKELMARHKAIADFLEIIGIDREAAEIDACLIEHQVSPETAARLQAFVRFIQDRPKDPKWLEKFKSFYDTGEEQVCED